MPSRLIHVAKIRGDKGQETLLFLRELESKEFEWFLEKTPTAVLANSIEEAIRLGWKTWKDQSFYPLACGYRFSLPERDEHGTPALYWQMVKSLASPNGVYFDELLGHSCIVNQVPLATRRFAATVS